MGETVWFQLYVYKDRGITLELLRRAEAAGCKALGVTVDAAAWGRREADLRNRFYLPAEYKLGNLIGGDAPADSGNSGLAAYVERMFKLDIGWQDIEWLRQHTRLPVVLKGIRHPEDAKQAVELGVRCVWVSNHGGRQLDTTEVLPRIAEAVGDRAELILDGGIHRGSDILKAVALGARAVAVARPVLWARRWTASEGWRGFWGCCATSWTPRWHFHRHQSQQSPDLPLPPLAPPRQQNLSPSQLFQPAAQPGLPNSARGSPDLGDVPSSKPPHLLLDLPGAVAARVELDGDRALRGLPHRVGVEQGLLALGLGVPAVRAGLEQMPHLGHPRQVAQLVGVEPGYGGTRAHEHHGPWGLVPGQPDAGLDGQEPE